MITDTLLNQVETILRRAGLTEQSVAALREAFPEQHFTHCLDDDIGAGIEPVRESEGFNLYLINAGGHCISFTRSQETATGVVLAEVSDSD